MARYLDLDDLETMRKMNSVNWKRVREILEDPLEMQVALSEDAWNALKERFEDMTGLTIREGRWNV